MPTAKTAVVPKSYFALVRKFPLVPLRDAAHLAAASAVVDQLLTRDLDDGGEAYLEVLSDLILAYEDKMPGFPESSPPEVLAYLLDVNGLSQSELARRTGISQSTISAALGGSRRFTGDQAVALGKFFALSPAAFLSDPDRRRSPNGRG